MSRHESSDVHTYGALLMRAMRHGCELVLPGLREILIDFDDTKLPVQWFSVLSMLTRKYNSTNTRSWRSRSGNIHMVVELGVAIESQQERIALQAICGSDPMRELLAMRDIRNGNLYPSVLFRPLPKQITAGPFSQRPVYKHRVRRILL